MNIFEFLYSFLSINFCYVTLETMQLCLVWIFRQGHTGHWVNKPFILENHLPLNWKHEDELKIWKLVAWNFVSISYKNQWSKLSVVKYIFYSLYPEPQQMFNFVTCTIFALLQRDWFAQISYVNYLYVFFAHKNPDF